MFSYSPNFYQERLQRLVVRCISICRAVIRHLQGSKLTRDMMVMKVVTAWCCRVRSAVPEIQFPTEQRGSILYSFLLYPLHKIFSHLQNKKVRNNVFLYIKIDFWHGRSGRSWLSYPITFLCIIMRSVSVNTPGHPRTPQDTPRRPNMHYLIALW